MRQSRHPRRRLTLRERRERKRLTAKRSNDRIYAKLMAMPSEERRAFTSARQRGVTRRRSGIVKKLRAANVCVVCGGHCDHAHHVDPETKRFPLGKAALHSYSEIIREARKCTCVCEPHHRDVHAGRVKLTDPPRLIVRPDMLPPSAFPAVFRLARRMELSPPSRTVEKQGQN